MKTKNFEKWLKENHELTTEQFSDLEASKQADLLNKHGEYTQKALEAAIEAKASKEDIENLEKQLSDTVQKSVDKINGILKNQGEVLRNIAKTEKNESPTLLAELMKNKEKLSEMKTSKQESLVLELKANIFKTGPTDMTSANAFTGDIPQATRLPGIDDIRQRRVRLMDVVTTGGMTGTTVDYVTQDSEEGGAGATAEGAEKKKYSTEWKVVSHKAKKVTAFSKVTTEMLEDVVWLEGEIRRLLTQEVLRDVEQGAWDADGQGENMEGIFPEMPAFAPGDFADLVENANEVDVLTVAANQIRVNSEGTAEPSAIMMHPTDLTKLLLIKVAENDRRYVDRLVSVGGRMTLDGIPIIQTTLLDQGEAAIGDWSLATILQRQGITIDIGLDGDDFRHNRRTILAEGRFASFIRENDKVGFVRIEDFEAAKGAIEVE